MLTRKLRRLLRAWGREEIERRSRWDVSMENAGCRAMLDRCWVANGDGHLGRIGVAILGMDCDCSAYGRQYVVEMPNCVVAFKRWFDEHCEGLEGPETQRFMRPDQVDRSQNWSRDRALEAFEDGHPHVVYV